MNHVTKQNQLFLLDSQSFCFCVWQQLFHTERRVNALSKLVIRLRERNGQTSTCVISAVIRLKPIHGNELVEQMESLKVIENNATSTDNSGFSQLLESWLRLASSCLKRKDLSVKFK